MHKGHPLEEAPPRYHVVAINRAATRWQYKRPHWWTSLSVNPKFIYKTRPICHIFVRFWRTASKDKMWSVRWGPRNGCHGHVIIEFWQCDSVIFPGAPFFAGRVIIFSRRNPYKIIGNYKEKTYRSFTDGWRLYLGVVVCKYNTSIISTYDQLIVGLRYLSTYVP